MNEVERIYDQLRRSYDGPAWHGPALREILEGVSEEMSARRIGQSHNICELVRHVAVWEELAIRVLAGAAYPGEPTLPPEEDWPASLKSFADERERLERTHRALEEAVRSFAAERLEEKVKGNRDFTYYFLLHGIVQHNLYHAGQMAILKKGGA